MNDLTELERSEYRWGVDQNLVNFIFIPIYQARENFNNKEYELALDNFEFSWDTLRVTLLDRKLESKEKEQKEIENYIIKIDNLIQDCNKLMIPSSTLNPNIRQREDFERMYNLKLKLKELSKVLMAAMKISGLWFKKNQYQDPGRAVEYNFGGF